MSETDLIKLYSQKILRLAADIPHVGHLDTPTGTANCRAPLCGSTVAVDVVVEDGKLTEFAQDVKACALGQAAASIVGANILGCDLSQIESTRAELENLLKHDGPTPADPFGDLETLRPAKEFKNRHASILLSLDATIAAFTASERKKRA